MDHRLKYHNGVDRAGSMHVSQWISGNWNTVSTTVVSNFLQSLSYPTVAQMVDVWLDAVRGEENIRSIRNPVYLSSDKKLIKRTEMEAGVWNKALTEIEPIISSMDVTTGNLVHRMRSGRLLIRSKSIAQTLFSFEGIHTLNRQSLTYFIITRSDLLFCFRIQCAVGETSLSLCRRSWRNRCFARERGWN